MKARLSIAAALFGSFVTTAGWAVDATAPVEQSRSSTRVPKNASDGNTSATTESGLVLSFQALREGHPSQMNEFLLATKDGVNRLLVDKEHQLFYGYHLEAQPTPDGRIRIEIKPLPEGVPGKLHEVYGCERCPSFTHLAAAAVRYPDPRVLDDGSLFTLELLRNAATGETLVDQVRIHRRETAPPRGPRLPAGGRFGFEFKLSRLPGTPNMLFGDFRLNDVVTGKNLLEGKMSFGGDPPKGRFSFPGLTPDGRPIVIEIRLSASPPENTLTYEFELREDGSLVQSQRVTVPLPPL